MAGYSMGKGKLTKFEYSPLNVRMPLVLICEERGGARKGKELDEQSMLAEEYGGRYNHEKRATLFDPPED